MADRFEMNTLKRIYDNQNGTYIEVSEDGDALGLVELKYVEDGETRDRLAFTVESASLVAAAILEIAEDVSERD